MGEDWVLSNTFRSFSFSCGNVEECTISLLVVHLFIDYIPVLIYAPHSTLIITKLVIIYKKVHSHFWKIWFQEMHIHFHSVLCSQEMLISLRLGFRSVCGNYCFNFYENKSIYLHSIISNFGCVNKNKMYYFLSIFLPKYLCFWFVSTILTLTYTMVSNIVVKITVVILNFIHNIWHRDTKVVPSVKESRSFK